MVEALDIYDQFDLPIHISEITIPCYTGKIAENEQIQAEITKIWYETWFATRNMKSIVWWNMVDGYAAYAPLGSEEGENRYGGGLVRFDMSKKPSYEVLDTLINREWKTNKEVLTEENKITFRGFYGEYEIQVETASGKKKQTVLLHKDGTVITL